MVHVKQYDLSRPCPHSGLMKPFHLCRREMQSAWACWGSKHLPGSQSQPPCTGFVLLAWQHKQQLSAGSYGECCFTSVSGIRPLKTPAKGLMSLAPRCDILLQALPVRYRKPDLSGEAVISRSLRGRKLIIGGPPCSPHAGPP